MKIVHVCTECDPPHVDNCLSCYGYGFKRNGAIIEAGDVENVSSDDCIACLECGGDVNNFNLIILYGDKSAQQPLRIIKA